jgi:threonine dehydrogenase-like Zn-dependent dehydrogenase
VIAVDIEERQLELARELGADVTINSTREDARAACAVACPDGPDVVFECTGVPALVDQALALCRTDGRFVWQGNYGQEPISFAFLVPHAKRLETFFPCDDGYMPCRQAVIKHMTQGVLPWDKTITHRIESVEAPAMFGRINRGDKDVVGVTIRWS